MQSYDVAGTKIFQFMEKAMSSDFQVKGNNAAAQFTLTLHRGDGMLLIAMNWRNGSPPSDFAGFAVEYREPGGDRFFELKNRLGFSGAAPGKLTTRRAPIQAFRWVHFPRNADMPGAFRYRVIPVFMNRLDELSYGEAQEAEIELRRETYPGKLNVAFTRGFVSSQAFVDRYDPLGTGIKTLLPAKAEDGMDFKPAHAEADDAYAWMGFEARREILEALNLAVADPQAEVRIVAFDLNLPEMVVDRLKKLGKRLKIIIDDSTEHGGKHTGETESAAILATSAGAGNVKRQHMGKLQHNKMIIVDGPTIKRAIGGSTNFSWRGFYVQANNAVTVHGAKAIKPFLAAFDAYWAHDSVKDFGKAPPAVWQDIGLAGIDAKVTFSPHAKANALLAGIAADIETGQSSVLYSLAFLYLAKKGLLEKSFARVMKKQGLFVFGISDKEVGGLDVQTPNGNIAPVFPAALTKNVPAPFNKEPTGGGGNRMHHKFVVIDFDKPTARVYTGSYNFSDAADTSNGENLFLIRDRRVAVSYMVEALRIFDHYRFRIVQQEAKAAKKKLELRKPPRTASEKTWWEPFYSDPFKIRDRELFA
jgi:phosphatidylserine/phosphatidylglycerophosphate/cardiolipin synthase-like enzyme